MVSALRQKLEAHGSRLIHTLRGHGYVFVAQPAGSRWQELVMLGK